MAHFAQIDSDNKVVKVLVVSDEQASDGQNYLANTLNLGGTWIQTSYNTKGGVHLTGGTPLRKNYAGIGYTYDATRDAFIPPMPFPSWSVLDEDTCLWLPPTPMPTAPAGKYYWWNESTLSWKLEDAPTQGRPV
jgi:hypothetical protein